MSSPPKSSAVYAHTDRDARKNADAVDLPARTRAPGGMSGPAPPTFKSFPHEVILHIFCQLPPTIYSRGDALPPYRWLVITQVCRDWRNIALNAPVLWTCICTLRPECIRVFLTRSQQMPLRIMCFQGRKDKKPDRILAALRIILPEFHRVAYFCLEGDPCLEFLQYPFPHGAPLLQNLDLQAHENVNIGMFDSIFGFGQGVPALEVLELGSCPATVMQTIVFPHLTKLSITIPSKRLSPDVWVSVLKNMPLLRSLILHDAIAFNKRFRNKKQDTRLHLPHLTELYLQPGWDESPWGELMLLERMVVPVDTKLSYVAVHDCHQSGCACQQVIDMIQAKLTESGQRPAPARLSISRSWEDISVALWGASVPPSDGCVEKESIAAAWGLQQGTVFRFTIRTCKLKPDIPEAVCRMLLAVYPLEEVEALQIMHKGTPFYYGPPRFDIQQVRTFNEAFKKMTNLHTLLLSNPIPIEYADKLLGAEPSDGPGQPLFPCLKQLGVRNVVRSQVIAVADMIPILRRRQDAGHAIEHVHVCNATAAPVPEGLLSQIESHEGNVVSARALRRRH